MPLFSLSRLLIFEEKEAHYEKMHAHPGSHKIELLRELGATINLQPAAVDGKNYTNNRVSSIDYSRLSVFCQFKIR